MTITNAIVTVYLATGHVCSNGHFPTPNYTVASSDRSIPLGTKVLIEGHIYVVEDRTNKRFSKEERFDIFTSQSKNWALKFGKKKEKVEIYETQRAQ